MTRVPCFKVHPLAHDAKTNHRALTSSFTLCSVAACFGRLWSQTKIYCPLYLQPSQCRKHDVPLLFIQFTLVGRQCSSAVPKKKKRSILQVFQSFQTGTTDTDASPACVLNLVANMGTGRIEKRITWGGQAGLPLHCSYRTATKTKESNGDKGAKSPKSSLAMCGFSLLV